MFFAPYSERLKVFTGSRRLPDFQMFDFASGLLEYAKSLDGGNVAETYGYHKMFWDTLYNAIRKGLHVDSMHDALKLIASCYDDELWAELTSKMSHVDYTQLVEHDDATSRQEALACAGGVCEI